VAKSIGKKVHCVVLSGPKVHCESSDKSSKNYGGMGRASGLGEMR
jgi:hypothetical protein